MKQARTGRQETILIEAASRIRRYAGLPQTEKHKQPLIVVASKFDEWSHLLGLDEIGEPWRETADGYAMDRQRVDHISDRLRELMIRLCPEIVGTAEGFAQRVVYMPTSAIGWNSAKDPESDALAIRPKDLKPFWAAVPITYSFCRWLPGAIPTPDSDEPVTFNIDGVRKRRATQGE